jgi:cytochrome c oxidase cbb3-type subunit III
MKRILQNIALYSVLILGTANSYAQDGAQLFKAKCNTCHMVDKNSTGPLLKGVKQKWNDAGEGDFLYEWVKNPQTLIATGKSKVALEAKNFSPTEMSPQAVSNEEIDAILDYVDNYTPPVDPVNTAGTSGGEKTVMIVTNYKENLSLFYWLLVSTIVLLLAIIIMSTSITSLIRSDFFKKKLVETEGKNNSGIVTTVVALIGSFLLLSTGNTAHAFTFNGPGEAAEGQPWLLIENSDLYALVAVNLILIGVLLYLRRMFKEFLSMVRAEKVKAAEEVDAIKKLNKILTDVVPIEEEHTILMHHEYDGIRELDNNLPPWWVWGFYATIIFAVVYMFNYHILGTSDLQIAEYNKEMAQAKKDVDAYLSKMAMNVDENNAELMTEEKDLSAGKALYEANCVACHNPKGEGNIGPNLTDDHWVYGPDIKDVFKTIKYGTPNGMPEHASKLNPIQLQQVSSFVLSLPFTAGKEPEGKEYK